MTYEEWAGLTEPKPKTEMEIPEKEQPAAYLYYQNISNLLNHPKTEIQITNPLQKE